MRSTTVGLKRATTSRSIGETGVADGGVLGGSHQAALAQTRFYYSSSSRDVHFDASYLVLLLEGTAVPIHKYVPRGKGWAA